MSSACNEFIDEEASLIVRSEFVQALHQDVLDQVDVKAETLGSGDVNKSYTASQIESDFESILNIKASHGETESTDSKFVTYAAKIYVGSAIDGAEALQAFEGLYSNILSTYTSLPFTSPRYVFSDVNVLLSVDTLEIVATSFFADGVEGPEGGSSGDCVGSFQDGDCWYAGQVWPSILGGGVSWGGGPCDGTWEADGSNSEAAQTVVEDAINAAVPTMRPAKDKFSPSQIIVYDDIECLNTFQYPGPAECDDIFNDFFDPTNTSDPGDLGELSYNGILLNCAQCHITEFLANQIPAGYVLTSVSIITDGLGGGLEHGWFIEEYCFGIPRVVEITDELPTSDDLL
jgi:hypothetical protein